MIEIRFVDGTRQWVPESVGDRVVGKDADGDVLIPLDKELLPDHFVPLTPCCFGTGKGSESPTGVVCRGCYRVVDAKYGGNESIAVEVANPRYTCTDPECTRPHTSDGGALTPESFDPNAALAEIRSLAAMLLDIEQIDAAEHAQEVGTKLAQKITDLDQHVSSYYGTLPEAWDEHQW